MGILSDRLFSAEPWLHDSPDSSDPISHDVVDPGVIDRPAPKAFLDWRWAMPITPPAPFVPANTTEQPAFDALYATSSWNAEDEARFVEFDGFLIDRQTAAATCGYPYDPVAA